jgi:hypothetical protein
MTRPVSITVVAWVIIASSLEGVIATLGGLITPLYTSGLIHTTQALPLTLWLGEISLSVNIALAVLMLTRFGWARAVYVCLLTVGIVSLVLTRQPISIAMIQVAKLAVFTYFLFRAEANTYFSATASKRGLTDASRGP